MSYPTASHVNLSGIQTFNQNPSFTNITTNNILSTNIDVANCTIFKNGFINSTSGNSIKTRHNNGANDNNNAFDFYTLNNTTSTLKLSISSQGIGINTSNPSRPLTVIGTSPQIYVYNGTMGNQSSIVHQTTTPWIVGTNVGNIGGAFGFYQNSTALSINTSGNIGINYNTNTTSAKIRVSPTFGISDGDYIYVNPEATNYATTRLIGKNYGTHGFTSQDTTEIYTPGGSNSAPRLVLSSGGVAYFNGSLGVGRKNPGYAVDVAGDLICTSWFRSRGNSGWYSETYGGGWWMSDSTWVRSYGSKSVWMDYGWVTTDGYIGIRTSAPSYPLHVNGYEWIYAEFRWLNSTGGDGGAGGTVAYSIGVTHAVACQEFNLFSDERIKTNIIDIDDTSALNIIRQIQPKKYNYKDPIKKGNGPVWGFIAQQVESVLDYSVNMTKDFIPDLFDDATVSSTTNGTCIITLDTKSVMSLNDTAHSTSPLEIRLYLDDDGKDSEKIVHLKRVINENSFEVEENIENLFSTINGAVEHNYRVFAYGKKVDDFRNLNKDAIFTIATSALQEVDVQLQDTISRIDDLELQINTDNIDSILLNLETSINNLLQT